VAKVPEDPGYFNPQLLRTEIFNGGGLAYGWMYRYEKDIKKIFGVARIYRAETLAAGLRVRIKIQYGSILNLA
jgi:hypothetical protein